MRAPPATRIALAAAGAAVAVTADRGQAALAAGVVVAAFLLAGEIRLLLRLTITLAPLLLFSAALWTFVGGMDLGHVPSALERLVQPGAPFLSLVRALVGSCAIVLALGTVPDGEGVAMLRRLGIPIGAATIISSGGSAASGIGEGFQRSVTALRAHGIVGPGPFSRLRHLGSILALTWNAALSEMVVRAEGKWSGNGFLSKLDPVPRASGWSTARGGSVALAAAASLCLILLDVAR